MTNASKPINAETMHSFALDLITLMSKKGFFSDVNIFVNNQKWTSNPCDDKEYTKHIIEQVTYYVATDSCDVNQQIEYCNPKTVTITFEGPMYHAINYQADNIINCFDKLASVYGLYTELGHAWSLSFYEL